MTKEEYKHYLKSKHWKSFRNKTITSCCWCCGFRGKLNLHHTSYENLYRETFMDIVTLCERCHKKVHELINRRDALLFNAHFILKGLPAPEKDTQKKIVKISREQRKKRYLRTKEIHKRRRKKKASMPSKLSKFGSVRYILEQRAKKAR